MRRSCHFGPLGTVEGPKDASADSTMGSGDDQRRRAKTNRCHVEAPFFVFLIIFHPSPLRQTFFPLGLLTEHGSVVPGQGECRRHMDLPHPNPTMIRDFRFHLDQTVDEPLH